MEQADYIAWSLYTGSSYHKNFFDDESSAWVVGQWDGINGTTEPDEIKRDIDCRISAVINAFKKASLLFKTDDRHFVIPEFFFHCRQGPYPFKRVGSKGKYEGEYPFEYIVSTLKEKLKECIPKDDNDYTIIIGSVLTSNISDYQTFFGLDKVGNRQDELNEIVNDYKIYNAFMNHDFRSRSRGFIHKEVPNKPLNELNKFMHKASANPLCTVRSRGAYFHFNQEKMDDMEVFLYEKKSESSVDLTMGIFNDEGKIIHHGMITEWLANYPSHSLYHGDKQTTDYSTNARFSPLGHDKSDIGVEICLDHYNQRLRRTVDMNSCNGANADHYPLVKQFVPSGGEQLRDYAIAAHKNSVIFNADGARLIIYDNQNQGRILKNGKTGLFKGITSGVYNQSIQSTWKGRDGQPYYSHSQLAFTTDDSVVEGFNNAELLKNTLALTYNGSERKPYNNITDSYIAAKPIDCNIDEEIFALNEGELHHYSNLRPSS